MNRLMKAEWYRVRHSSGLMKWVIIVCLFSMAFVMLTTSDLTTSDAGKHSLAEILYVSGESYFFIMYFLAVISAVIVGTAYTNKTAYYEVMAGNKISGILLSKVLVDAVFVAVASSLFLDLYWLVIGMHNGIGEITQLPLRFVLLAVVFFHVCSTGVLIATTIQHNTGAVLSFLRFSAFDMLVPFCIELLGNFSEEAGTRMADWFVMLELSKLLNCEIRVTNHLIVATVLGMLIEAGLWYSISYVRMKKKLYN